MRGILKPTGLRKGISDVTLQWDEDIISEHDKDRGTRTKIDEPKTPYLGPAAPSSLIPESTSDEFFLSPAVEQSYETDFERRGSVTSSRGEPKSDAKSMLDQVKFALIEGEAERIKDQDFNAKRKAHYDEFFAARQLRKDRFSVHQFSPHTMKNFSEMVDANRIIRDVVDFPKKGIVFKDIMPCLANPDCYRYLIDRFCEFVRKSGADLIVAPEARGFLFGGPVAYALKLPFVVARKAGKLPGPTVSVDYKLEYGAATLEMQDSNIITKESRCYVIDDIWATGGTGKTLCNLVTRCGGFVAGIGVIMSVLVPHPVFNGENEKIQIDVIIDQNKAIDSSTPTEETGSHSTAHSTPH